ncbi:MAG: hypothetical protein Q4C98_09550, partial [Capnocytophaga sp.]|nr:hypothetical protein [Capnocytophaga sp.]
WLSEVEAPQCKFYKNRKYNEAPSLYKASSSLSLTGNSLSLTEKTFCPTKSSFSLTLNFIIFIRTSILLFFLSLSESSPQRYDFF